ncbi:MAG: hypothetical protein VXY28_04875 [Bacteroidota bacterium]|nr:hypothetical protein [Bacteroidota bacterium]
MTKTKLTLLICGVSSLLMGLVFFFFPHFYASLEGANFENIAWLRNLGAALIAVNGVGALLAYKEPEKEKKLYDVVLLASSLETLGLVWSTLKWEFSATSEWFIKIPLLLAALVTILLIIYRPKPIKES